MFTTYRLKADELDDNFLKSIKSIFKGKDLEISIQEADDTGYLFNSPENKKHIIDAIEDVENNKNIITPSQEQFK
jgi:antitoxin YefM